MLAAGGIGTDGAGFHVGRPVKGGRHPFPPSFFKHLSGCFAYGDVLYLKLLIFIYFV